MYLGAKAPARVDGPLEANWREKTAQKQLAIRMAVDVEQGHPALGLLADLLNRVVVE